MRYDDPRLRDMLAAEYVLGTLAARPRRRFQRLLRYDVDLRRTVAQWEARLTPLAGSVPAVEPPARVWRAIEARIARRRPARSWWSSTALWRGAAAVSTALVIALATLLVARMPAEDPAAGVAVLTDGKSPPAMVVSWPLQSRYVRVRMLAQPPLPSGRSFELWMLPGGDQAPVSLGVIAASPTQTVALSERASAMLPGISGLAVSVEPEGGSKTGAPTGPVILSGPIVKLL